MYVRCREEDKRVLLLCQQLLYSNTPVPVFKHFKRSLQGIDTYACIFRRVKRDAGIMIVTEMSNWPISRRCRCRRRGKTFILQCSSAFTRIMAALLDIIGLELWICVVISLVILDIKVLYRSCSSVL